MYGKKKFTPQVSFFSHLDHEVYVSRVYLMEVTAFCHSRELACVKPSCYIVSLISFWLPRVYSLFHLIRVILSFNW